MARFGRDIVRQLTDPTMAQGMFELGRQIGGLPGERRKKKAEEQKKTALIDLENQLRQTAAAGAEAARTGQVDAIELQIKSINEQLKTEQDEAKRKRLTDTYTLLSENLATARGVQETVKGQAREVDIAKAVRGGNLSSADGNAVGITTARMRLAKLLETETDEKRRSDIFSAMDNLDEQLKGVDQVKAQRNVDDLLKAEKLYKRLEAESESRANILANADPKSEEYLRAKNESAAMVGIKQRMDELKADPDAAQAVRSLKREERIKEIEDEERLLQAEGSKARRILFRYDIDSKEFAEVSSMLKDRDLGEVVSDVEKVKRQVKKDKLELQELQDKNAPLTKQEKAELAALTPPIGLTGNVREDRRRYTIYGNRKIEKAADIAMQGLEAPEAPRAKALVKQRLEEMAEDGDINTFFKDDLSDKIDDLLKNPKELENVIGIVAGLPEQRIPSEITAYIAEKFPKEFADMEVERSRKSKIAGDKQEALRGIAENTNKARGKAAFEAGLISENRPLKKGEEGYFDLDDPDDSDRAMMQYERDESKKRREKTKEQSKTTGRAEAYPISYQG